MKGAFSEGVGPGLVYVGYRSAAWLAERIPLRWGDAVASLGAQAAYRLARRKRALVGRNLARVVGEGSQLDAVVREAFHSYARYWLETFRSPRYSKAQLLELVTPDNNKVFEDALAEGRGVIIVTAHFGFYDLGVAWFGAMGYRTTTVAEVLRPRVLFDWFAEKRRLGGMPVIPAKPSDQARRRLVEVINAGESVALVAERDLGRRGIWVEFFGERTTIPAFPSLLVARTGAPLLTAGIYSVDDGYRMTFERVPYELAGDERRDAEFVAQKIAFAIERLVKIAPEQWHLFSTNWPSDEAGLPPRGGEVRQADPV